MKTLREMSSLICFNVLLNVCLLSSVASDSGSLWGKKILFKGPTCLWQLHPNTEVPALQELTVCVLLRRDFGSPWTGFMYKAPWGRRELGLQGRHNMVSVWLFGEEVVLEKDLEINQWHSVCITWSGQAQRLQLYINGTPQYELMDHTMPQNFTPSGSLTLGMSHFVVNGEVMGENGSELLGQIGLFRMWDREWSSEEMEEESCADGNVVSWDLRQWKHGCPPLPDTSLHCAWSLYKIKMWIIMDPAARAEICPVSVEEATRQWLEDIFPPTMAVSDISVLSPSGCCDWVDNSAEQHVQQAQESWALTASNRCFSCDVYVTVDPAANVSVVQADVTARLTAGFFSDSLSLTVDPESISILPIESFSPVLDPSTTVTTEKMSPGPTYGLPTQPSNISTTGEPLDFNKTFVEPIFFRVNLLLNMKGISTDQRGVISTWVQDQLRVNTSMIALNFVIIEVSGSYMEQYNGLVAHSQQTQYNCTFHVQEDNGNTEESSKSLIEVALMSPYENESFSIQPMGITIKLISPKDCPDDTTSTIYGDYFWPSTFPAGTYEILCTKGGRAKRHCKLHINTDDASWALPDMRQCKPLIIIPDLANVTVTTGNADEVVGMINDLVDSELGNSSELSSSDLDVVVEKLSEVVDVSVVNPAVGANIVKIVANLLLSKTNMTPVANIILKLTETMGNNMNFQDETVNVTAPLLALSMVNVEPDDFRGLTFGVSSISSTLSPEIFLNRTFVNESPPNADASISLPAALHDIFSRGLNKNTRIQFQFYGTQELFQDSNITIETKGTWDLNSYVVSASVSGSHVSNLMDRVLVTLNHQRPTESKNDVSCVFWDFQKHGGQGGWSRVGCETKTTSRNRTSCLCDHLTHFAVLLDVSRGDLSDRDSGILTVISYLGCGISAIFLGVTLLTYFAFEKLRRDYPSKILINLSSALLGLSMIFLLNSWLSSFNNYGLCIATAATLHFFLLASFTWMGLEAVHMYLALVKVFNIYVPAYILKFCAVGWGIPLLIVSVVLAVDKDVYGRYTSEESRSVLQSSEMVCWLQDDVYFYVTVVAFFLLILLCNISVFIVVLIQIKRMGVNKPSANRRTILQDLRAVASITILLGLTWAVGFFSFGPGRVVMLYLFCIFNSFQGFFIFLFHCLMKENVRKEWRIHLCCGRFRVNDCSDWSHTVTGGGGHGKKSILVNSDSVASDTTTRKVSDSSTGSAPNHQQRV